jgi:hypothetical protein
MTFILNPAGLLPGPHSGTIGDVFGLEATNTALS